METVQCLLAKPHSLTSLVPEYWLWIITPQNSKSSHCPALLCAACQFGKQKQTTPPLNAATVNSVDGGVSKKIATPGRQILVDLYVCQQKGHLTTFFGKEAPEAQYSGGAIFVDHVPHFIFNQHQFFYYNSWNSLFQTSLWVLLHFTKRQCYQYIIDNHPFHDAEWKLDCEDQNQLCHFSGVWTHPKSWSNATFRLYLICHNQWWFILPYTGLRLPTLTFGQSQSIKPFIFGIGFLTVKHASIQLIFSPLYSILAIMIFNDYTFLVILSTSLMQNFKTVRRF